jgi:hypothetical protein
VHASLCVSCVCAGYLLKVSKGKETVSPAVFCSQSLLVGWQSVGRCLDASGSAKEPHVSASARCPLRATGQAGVGRHVFVGRRECTRVCRRECAPSLHSDTRACETVEHTRIMRRMKPLIYKDSVFTSVNS